ncbi:SIS domain-containing protein [Lactobacillus sp. ESL0731]|uniref:SIS domain-containing protein n=1 Tax=unclassified Lactobacillus TaxID=2620435 RepID=UPI0023F9ED94|nr:MULTISPECIES: SIS domain-containing protein [unclassified Lactobacillus]WEV51576.1 SIS domain-containing protein [Lactobacillus sp. ESL0700]WEV62705.1 SIS domain-containing protein [Lactobacillus sp. ESL0731]
MKETYQQEIKQAVAASKKIATINHIYFVACGGSMAFLQPGEYILNRECEIPATVLPSREFTSRNPRALNDHSIVISCSHSGTTPETNEAVKFAKSKGALTIAITFTPDSPLEKNSDITLHYSWGKGTDASDLNTGVLYGFIFEFLKAITGDSKYDKGVKALDDLETIAARTRKQYDAITKKWTSELKREKLIYAVGSGINAGETYSFSACWLQEMQWINSSYINSAEYFHGPFEVTDFDVPFIICEGMGVTRQMDQRVVDFAKKHSDKVYVIDNQDFDMHEIDDEFQEYYSQIISGVVYRQLAEGFAYERGHSLDIRRYMWHLDY